MNANLAGYRGERAAHRAAENGHVNCLRLCIENGFDVDTATVLGNTASHYAATTGANGCIRLLSDELADITRRNVAGRDPADICAMRGGEGSTRDLIRSLAIGGEDLTMRRRRHIELRRQNGVRKKKGVLFGRDMDGGEGGHGE